MPRPTQKQPAPHLDPSPNVSVGEEVPLEAVTGEARPHYRPVPMFMLYWQPGVGAFSMRRLSDGTPLLVPRIQVLQGIPGLDGVDGGDGRDLDWSIPVRRIAKRGGVVFDAATMRRAKLPSYLRKHKLAAKDAKGHETFAYLPPWRRLVRTQAGTWTIATDEDAKTRWESLVMSSGVVPKPDDAALLDMLERRSRRVSRHLRGTTQADIVARDEEQQDRDAELKAIEAAGFTVDELDPSASYRQADEVELPEVQDG